MKKIIIVIVIAAAALFIGAPYFTGKAAETETLKMIDSVNQSESTYGTTEIVSYERGVRSTKAKYRYTLPPAFQAFAPNVEHINYSCDSQHGITGIDYQCELDGETAYSKFVDEHLGGKNPVSVYGQVSAFGGFTQTIELDEIKDLTIEGETISLPSAIISVESDIEFSQFSISGGSDAFSFEDNETGLSMGKTSIDAELSRVQESVFVGDFSMSLDSLTGKDETGTASFEKISLSSNSAVNGDNIDTTMKVNVKSMNLSQGPVKSIEDVNYMLVANGLDTQAMADYQAYAQKMQQDMLSALENDQAPQADPMQMATLFGIVERMLKANLHMKNTVEAKINGKPNSFALDVKLLEDSSMQQLAMFFQKPEQVLAQFDASLVTSIDRSLIDSQQGIAGLVSQSPIVKTDKQNYSVDIQLGKEIELNGKKMSFQELQYAVLSSMPF